MNAHSTNPKNRFLIYAMAKRKGREQLIDHTNVNDRLIDNQQPQSSSAISAVFEDLWSKQSYHKTDMKWSVISRTTLFLAMA